MKFKEEHILLALFTILAMLFISFFKRDNSVLSKDAKELLSNKSDRKAIKEAMENGDKTVKTSQGILNI